MNSFRLVMLTLSLFVFGLTLYHKSRMSRVQGAHTAFAVHKSGSPLVMVSGDVRHPGIYVADVNAMARNVIKMAQPGDVTTEALQAVSSAQTVHAGEELHVSIRTDGTATVAVSRMSAAQCVLMGIPLDINLMNANDFELLPGVGPVLAERIVRWRQNNGGIMLPSDLATVEGVSHRRFQQLLHYF